MIKSIKFSSNYPKLHNQTEGRLVSVKIIDYSDLTKEIIEYDTKNIKGEYYPLPKTTLIHLTFIGNKLIPFCTIRRYTVQKYNYYRQSLHEYFSLDVTS